MMEKAPADQKKVVEDTKKASSFHLHVILLAATLFFQRTSIGLSSVSLGPQVVILYSTTRHRLSMADGNSQPPTHGGWRFSAADSWWTVILGRQLMADGSPQPRLVVGDDFNRRIRMET